jgi:prepilin-type N-terminal cleavage/methylation domain-containing protein
MNEEPTVKISRPRGFTLLEVVVATAIVGIVFAIILGTFKITEDGIGEGVIQTGLDMEAAGIVEQMANEIKDAQASSIKTGLAGGFTANDGITFTKADNGNLIATATPPFYGYAAGTKITYRCQTFARPGLTIDGRPNVLNCLLRDSTPVGLTLATQVLTDHLSGDPSNNYPALDGEQEQIIGTYVSPPTSTIRIPVNPQPDPSDPHPSCPRAVYIAANTYANSSGVPMTYVDIYVIVSRVNYQRYLNVGKNVSNGSGNTTYLQNAYLYTQLGYAHTRVTVNNP